MFATVPGGEESRLPVGKFGRVWECAFYAIWDLQLAGRLVLVTIALLTPGPSPTLASWH